MNCNHGIRVLHSARQKLKLESELMVPRALVQGTPYGGFTAHGLGDHMDHTPNLQFPERRGASEWEQVCYSFA